MIVSDHSPCTPAMKELETGDFGAAWGGISSLQLGLPVVWTEARRRGYSLDRRCALDGRATRPRLAGLDAQGADCGRLRRRLCGLRARRAASSSIPAALHHRHPITPYAGHDAERRRRETYLRGRRIDLFGRPAGELIARREQRTSQTTHRTEMERLMKILVVNVNTSQSMSDVIDEAARRAASPDTEIVTLTPFFGAEGVDCNFESYISAVAVMDRVLAYDEPFDAVVMAGFGEHGRDGLQELIEQPVIEICEASAHMAMLIGRSYSVVTTLQRSVAAIEDRLRLGGLSDRCASVRANGMSTLEVDNDPGRRQPLDRRGGPQGRRARPCRGDLPRMRRHGGPRGGDHLRARRAGDRRRRRRGAASPRRWSAWA